MDVSKIMSENFDMILNRDKNLGKISEMSTNLKDNSKKVKHPLYRCLPDVYLPLLSIV